MKPQAPRWAVVAGWALVALLAIVARVIAAPVPCSPTSCSPGCCGSCTYYTCDRNFRMTFSVNTIPTSPAPDHGAAACSEVGFGAVYRTLPFTHQGRTYRLIPATIRHDWRICQRRRRSNSSCCP